MFLRPQKKQALQQQVLDGEAALAAAKTSQEAEAKVWQACMWNLWQGGGGGGSGAVPTPTPLHLVGSNLSVKSWVVCERRIRQRASALAALVDVPAPADVAMWLLWLPLLLALAVRPPPSPLGRL